MPKLLDQVRERIRVKHCSDRTAQSFVHWIKQQGRFTNLRLMLE